jgi:sugar lactone lactonase YvrE
VQFTDTKLIPLSGEGPEDVVVDAEGQLYTGLEDGRILRVSPDGRTVQTVAEIDGRVYGVELYGDDELVVCAGRLGLLAVSLADGKARTLFADSMRACNNAAVAADGTIYFSDSSTAYDIPEWRRDLMHQTRTGRLLRHTQDGAVDELLTGLHFANGVALAPDESFVTVAETGAFAVRRVWLTGAEAERNEVFIENLSAFPDNVSTGSDGLIWIALASPRVKTLDLVQRLPRRARNAVLALPERLQPQPSPTVGALGLNADGRIVREYSGEIDGFTMLTAVRERDGWLYFSSLVGQHLVAMPYPH